MPKMDGLLHTPSSSPRVFEGIIARTPNDLSDLLEATVPAFDNEEWDELPWMPRGTDMPSEGDRCAIGLAETDHPGAPSAWILIWWPS